MRRLTLSGVCLAVLGVFAAVSAAAAAASEPAIYECGKASKEEAKYESKGKQKTKDVYTGKYTDKHCSSPAPAGKYRAEGKPEGKYELQEWNLTAKKGKAKAFKGNGKGADLEVEGLGGITCTSSSDTGKFNSPTSANQIVVTFKGCEFIGKKCESASTAGEIVTKDLIGDVGYLQGKGTGSPKVGADISPESGEALATFECGEDRFAVIGSVIGEISPANQFTKEATFTFKQTAEVGVQQWTKFEEGPEDILRTHLCAEAGCNPLEQAGPGGKSAEETVVVNKGEELELKA